MGNLDASCEEVLDQISRTISVSLADVERLEQADLSQFRTSLPGISNALDCKIANFLVAIESDLDKNEKVFDQLCSQMDDAAEALRNWLANAATCLGDQESIVKNAGA